MAKTNYTKVEEALTEGLRKLTISQLIEMADAASKSKTDTAPVETPARLDAIQKALVSALKRDLERLHKQDTNVYEKIGVKKKEIKKFIDNPNTLTPEEWESIKQIKDKIDIYKKELTSSLPKVSDDQIVEGERVKHINKRFNINEKWLPLK